MNPRFLFPVLLILVGCGDSGPRDLDTFVRQGDLYLDPETMTPYSGPVFSLYPGTQDLKEKGNLKDGVWSDPYEYYFHDGQLWFSGSHDLPRNPDDLIQQGDLDLDPETMEPYTGPFVDFPVFRGVQIQTRGTYSNGKLYGPFWGYDENGQLRIKGSFSNGVPDGPWVYYHELGPLMEKGSYSNGEKCGEWVEDGRNRTYDPCPNG